MFWKAQTQMAADACTSVRPSVRRLLVASKGLLKYQSFAA